MRIAVGGIHTECSTYSPHVQGYEDFTVIDGSTLPQSLGLAMYPDVEFAPLFYASSVPGGPVAAETYATFHADFLARLRAAMPVDGVLLVMHGAMHVVGMEDAEGDWISAVRDLVGPGVPISVSYDLHGNVTQRIVDCIDAFAAFRTAPHVDVIETRNRALSLLADHLRGGPRPMVGWCPVPALMPGERSSTEDSPARELYALLSQEDAQPGVSDANIMVGYVWADTPRATAAAVVTGTQPQAILNTAERLGAAYWAARTDFAFGVTTDGLDTCLDLADATPTTPVILADSGDNPTGGGVGDRADVLAAVRARGMRGAVFAGIAAPSAARPAAEAGEGATVPLVIGNGYGSDGPTVAATVRVLKVLGPDGKREVLVDTDGLRLILTEHRRPFHNLEDFRKFGIEPANERLIVVKSGYLSPELAPLASPALMALTDGAVNQHIPALANVKRPHPSYPFQTDFDWAPAPRLSARAAAFKET
ncbi:M81 family metallopeptidase [Tropicimonas marinistellae]|uniref:M81 family metallopeptidase n=1 Tax=Tropicimonas marinistellae TaxID=1739787 RepID=UPI00082A2F25|nr:M81 family metallopeptidase [Tropicimonas marinistellae]